MKLSSEIRNRFALALGACWMLAGVCACALSVASPTVAAGATGPRPTAIRFAAIGDSYTIGEGASSDEAWPSLLTHDLTKSGTLTHLVANPAVTGWTTQQALNEELPTFKAARPTFATLLIGVNDWVQGVDAATFKAHLIALLDGMQAALPDKHCLLLVTIPDFALTPTGAQFSKGRDGSDGITAFNDIIKAEAANRALPVVDVFPLSQAMGKDSSLVAADGLHPSAKEYAMWEALIFPAARALVGRTPAAVQ